MSHVDEGALHAYLDGALDEYPSTEAETIRAHLDACAACAERLEVERRIRSDAHDLLGLATPDVVVPSFEELRAYVQRTRGQRRGLGRLQRLGWAASIVVAIGAGWMLREGQLQSRATGIGSAEAPAPAAESQPLDAEGSEVDGTTARRPGAEVFQPRRPEVLPREVDARGAGTVDAGRADVGEAEALPRESRMDEARGAADLAAGADAIAGSTDRGAPPETVAETEPDLAAPPEAVDVPTDAVEALADGDEALADAGEIAQEAPLLPIDDTTVAAAAGAAWRGQVAERAMPSTPAPDSTRDVVVTAAPVRSVEASTAGVRPVRRVASGLGMTRQDAFGNARKTLPSDSLSSEPLASVPGHEVLSVVSLGDGTSAWGVRVRQRTHDGRVFEVFTLEEGVDPSILPDEGDGAGEVRAETSAGWVLIRGPLSERELAELLGSLFPGDS